MKKFTAKFNFKFGFMRLVFGIFAVALVIFLIVKTPLMLDAKEIKEFNRDLKNYNVKLQIIDAEQKNIAEFSIAIADNDYKKMYGLMNLDHLPKDHGMLFPFFRSHVVSMWMKDTLIPLDMLFIDKNDVIAAIKNDAQPHSLDIISSETEVIKVLEINGGAARRLGIKVGQKIKIL